MPNLTRCQETYKSYKIDFTSETLYDLYHIHIKIDFIVSGNLQMLHSTVTN